MEMLCEWSAEYVSCSDSPHPQAGGVSLSLKSHLLAFFWGNVVSFACGFICHGFPGQPRERQRCAVGKAPPVTYEDAEICSNIAGNPTNQRFR